MLAKKFRLPVNTFPVKARIFYRGGHFTIKTSFNSLTYNRVGVIATKKTAAGAVERNRLRRKIFDLFRETTRLRFAEGTDLLVLIKPIKLDRDAEEKLFKELNLVKSRLHQVSSIRSGKN